MELLFSRIGFDTVDPNGKPETRETARIEMAVPGSLERYTLWADIQFQPGEASVRPAIAVDLLGPGGPTERLPISLHGLAEASPGGQQVFNLVTKLRMDVPVPGRYIARVHVNGMTLEGKFVNIVNRV